MTELTVRCLGGALDLPFPGLAAPPGSIDGAYLDVGIRPEGVELLPEGQGIRGRVRSVQFLGEIDSIELAVEGLDAPLVARGRSRRGIRPGQDVGVHLSPRHVLAFPARDA
jgi:iron(III) transport system ATP-binding protein